MSIFCTKHMLRYTRQGKHPVFVAMPAPALGDAKLPSQCVLESSFFPHLSTENLPSAGRLLAEMSIQVYKCSPESNTL